MEKGLVRIGVRNFHFKELLTDDEDGATYGEPVRIEGLMSVGLSPQVTEGDLYADDILSEYNSAVTAFDITVGTKAFTEKQRAKLLGYPIDSNGKMRVTSNAIAPYFGVTFEAERSDGSYEFVQVHKVRFSPLEESWETKGSSISYQTPSISGKSMALLFNNAFYDMIGGTAENASVTSKWHESKSVEPIDTDDEDSGSHDVGSED